MSDEVGSGLDPLRARFGNFLWLVWDHLGLPAPTPVQLEIADYLQFGPKRAVIEAFRGVGKSWITSAFVLWRLYCNPQDKVLVVSASKNRADDFSTFTLRIINEMEVLQHLIPGEDQRNSKISFDVGPADAAHAPSVKSVGITGQLSGSRADFIAADDVEVPNNSATQMMQDKLSEAVKEFDAIIKPEEDSPNRQIVYLGTPQTEQTIYAKLEERGYTVRIWPARFPSPKQCEAYGERLAPNIRARVEADPHLVGHPTDPARFTDVDLVEREASYGRSGFALQFMLDTRLSDANRYPLKLRDLIVHSLDISTGPVKLAWGAGGELVVEDLPTVGFTGDRYHRAAWVAKDERNGQDEYAPYTGSVMFIDPAGRGKDETAYAVIKILHGTLFLVASGGFLDGYTPETLQALAHVAKTHGVNLVQVEPNFGDGMFTALIKPVFRDIYPVTIEETPRHSVQKEKRIIDTLEPVLNQHRLVVSHEVIQKDWESTQHLPHDVAIRYQLFYQLTRITRDKGALSHDDRLDALAMGVAYWVEQMATSTDQAVSVHRAELLQKELDRFMEHVIGGKPQQQGWLNRWSTRPPKIERKNRR